MIYKPSLRTRFLLPLLAIGGLAQSAYAAEGTTALSDLSASQGEVLTQTLEVPEGADQMSVSISGGIGDADLYVRYAAEPTPTEYDCRPFRTGNNETCIANAPPAGTYHIAIRAYTDFEGVGLLAGFNLSPNHGSGEPGSAENPLPLANGTQISDLTGSQDSTQYFELPLTADAGNALFSISGGVGDADIYVGYNQIPTLTDFTCRPFRDGNNEVCSITNALAGNYFVMINGYQPYSGVTLKAAYDLETGVDQGSPTPPAVPEPPTVPQPPVTPEPAPEPPAVPEPPATPEPEPTPE
ncbi:MAG: PPC domain-containing protein, partial [Granulosicoccus sp.]